MIDKRLYCETFSRLGASEEAKKEVFQMMEKTKKARRFPKVLRTAALAAMLTVALAVTANAASDGALFQQLRIVWTNGFETHLVGTASDGSAVAFTVTSTDPKVEEVDGRLLLHVLDEKVDITDELAENGVYHWTGEQEGKTVSVDVEGTLENWTISTQMEEDGVIYTVEEDGRTVVTEDGAEMGTAQKSTTVTVTEN